MGVFVWSVIRNVAQIEGIMMAEGYIDILCKSLWAYLNGDVDKTNITNKTLYYAALQKAWEYLKKLAECMPRRLEAVLKAKGGHTKY